MPYIVIVSLTSLIANPKRLHFPNFNTISNPLGQFNCLAVLYFPLGLSPNNWALTISFKSNYVKLYNVCNLLLRS